VIFRRTLRSTICALASLAVVVTSARAQDEYRNLESGRPLRIADATPTERYALDLDLTTIRVERLSFGRYRLQYEPRLAYGVLPRTEVSLRLPSYFRERSISPRRGIAGLGIGAETQLVQEGLHLPAIAAAAEAFVPTGPNSLRTSYSVKGVLTRNFTPARVHLNGSYGTFYVRGAPAGGVAAPPVIDGPCNVGVPEESMAVRAFCGAAVDQQSIAAGAAEEGDIITKYRWNAGIGIDKAFPLRSLLIAADIFTEKYKGIERDTEWTGELGARKQFNQFVVLDAALGRRFTGVAKAWFVTAGTTFTMPF
jgi:hypothetical protein